MGQELIKWDNKLLSFNKSIIRTDIIDDAIVYPDPPTNGLIAYYTLDSDGTDSVNGYNFPSSGSFSTGHIGNGMNMADSDLGNTNATFKSHIDNTNSFSYSFWIKPSSEDSKMMISCDGTNGSPYKRVWIYGNATDKWIYLQRYHASNMGNIGGVGVIVNIDTNIWDGGWHHVVTVYDNATSPYFFVYIDGDYEDGLVANDGWTSYATASMGTGFTSGVSLSGNYQNNVTGFTGTMDHLRIYNRAVSSTEVKSLYYET